MEIQELEELEELTETEMVEIDGGKNRMKVFSYSPFNGWQA